mmetsp:Transcript_19791/g.27208  ORF Transcript_19791/g.27208 Transcript_19791/m.27208 type:complete len:730 (-) Transcript_19791:249-2438(-)
MAQIQNEVSHYHESVLYRSWKPACIGAWGFFIAFQLCLGLDKIYSKNPLCPYSDFDYGNWYWYTCMCALGGFLTTWGVLLTKIVQSKPGNERVPYLTAFNIVSMGSLATILSLVFEWGGVCIDVLGVASPAAIWGEWCACGPLLVFIVVTLVDKSYLSKMDVFLIVSFFLCLITGFLIIVPQSIAMGYFWLTISCVTYLPLLYLPLYTRHHTGNIYAMPEDEDAFFKQYSERYTKRFNLSMVLTVILPLYTVIYIVALFGVVGPAETIAIYQVLSVLTKGLFSAVTMDVHLDTLLRTKRAIIDENERLANEARRGFLKYIFHEVRSPLNSLAIGIEILGRSNNLDSSDLESLYMMKDASEFMNDTLNDVLSMQKIEEGKLELDLCPFCISDAISKVFATFRGTVIAKSITLVKTVSPMVPNRVVGDRYRIEHVLANLLSNSIKFSASGATVVVEVTVVNMGDDDNKVTLLVEVKDEGPGISEENQKLLFGNFVQIRPGHLQEGRGSGLGLALCKQIVTIHGGTIGVNSEEGKGSVFFFSIPFQTYKALITTIEEIKPVVIGGESKTEQYSSKSTSISSSISSHKWPIRVLVVDDVESNRKMLKMLLKKHGLNAETVENGQLAVDTILSSGSTYELVFMDNLMPVMNGVEATRTLRRNGYSNLLIGVTGNVLEDDLAEYLNAGADLILSKPMKIATLQMLLDFIAMNGVTSKADMMLIEHSSKLQWTQRV